MVGVGGVRVCGGGNFDLLISPPFGLQWRDCEPVGGSGHWPKPLFTGELSSRPRVVHRGLEVL